MYRKTSLPASATVCSVSASSAGDPVSAAAIPFASAIAMLAASATITLPKLSSRLACRCKGTALIQADSSTARPVRPLRHGDQRRPAVAPPQVVRDGKVAAVRLEVAQCESVALDAPGQAAGDDLAHAPLGLLGEPEELRRRCAGLAAVEMHGGYHELAEARVAEVVGPGWRVQ